MRSLAILLVGGLISSLPFTAYMATLEGLTLADKLCLLGGLMWWLVSSHVFSRWIVREGSKRHD